jgi:hypothetical protein
MGTCPIASLAITIGKAALFIIATCEDNDRYSVKKRIDRNR